MRQKMARDAGRRVLGVTGELQLEQAFERALGARIHAIDFQISASPQLLPPLSPGERRLVHLALAQDPEVETESEGDGFLKRVAVRPRA